MTSIAVLVKRLFVLGLAGSLVIPAVAVRADDSPDWATAAAGAAVGGVVGNQVGGGRGRTAATAAGAVVGSVIASGCRVTSGTVVGGFLGGLLGSQVGGGNGRNVMAGVGASVGAMLGSDCSPVASASAPAVLSVPPFLFNGLSFKPVTGFPLEAFQGVPPMVSVEDIGAARSVARKLAQAAAADYKAGNVDSAMLKMYWAKRIGVVSMTTTGRSLEAMSSIRASRSAGASSRVVGRASSVSMSLPAKGIVILPTFNQDRQDRAKVASLWDSLGTVASADWSRGVAVADNSGLSGLLNIVGKVVGGQNGQPVGNGHRASAGPLVLPPEARGLPEGQVLQLDGGVLMMKTAGSMVFYNVGDEPVAVPLDKLDFVPRTPTPSAARMAAAGVMKRINENVTNWTFGSYKSQTFGRYFSVWFDAPNRIVDLERGGQVVAYVDGAGSVTGLGKADGERAYKGDASFRLAANVLGSVRKSSDVMGFANGCRVEGYAEYEELHGDSANLLTTICFDGRKDRASTQKWKQTFWLDDSGKAVQTLDSMIADQKVVQSMKKAMLVGATASDILGFVPIVGNIESGFQCAESPTASQALATSALMSGSLFENKFPMARLAGWKPDPQEWDVPHVANCLGAIPLAGTAIKVGKGGVGLATGVVSKLENPGRLEMVFNAFDNPSTLRGYVEGVKEVESLYPGNSTAASFVKSMYDGAMTGLNIGQLKDDLFDTVVAYRQ